MKKFYFFILLFFASHFAYCANEVITTIDRVASFIDKNSLLIYSNYEIIDTSVEIEIVDVGLNYSTTSDKSTWFFYGEVIHEGIPSSNEFSTFIRNLECNTIYWFQAFVCYRILPSDQYHFVFSETESFEINQKLTLWASGDNSKGQLGTGTFSNALAPIKINNDKDWKSVKAGKEHTLAIKTDGSLWAWGDNTYGQLGDGTNENKNIPTRIGTDNNWVHIACGYYHSIGIKADGSLWLWGRNDKGQLGTGSYNNSNVPVRVGEQNYWEAAAGGEGHTLATSKVENYNMLWSWGDNTFGQLGNASNTNSNSPQTVSPNSSNEYRSISAGQFHSIGIRFQSQNMYSFGYNNNGQLGDDTHQNRNEPYQILPNQNIAFKSISCGKDFNLAIDTSGNIYTWGNNDKGQLGEGTMQGRNVPYLIGNGPWKAAACGEDFSYAIKGDGTLWKWGSDFALSPLKEGSINKWFSVSAGGGHVLLLKDSDNDIDVPLITSIPNETYKDTIFKISWSEIIGAESYLLQIADNSDFIGENVESYPITDSSMYYSSANPGVYSIRVRAINGLDSSEWSEIKYVKIIRAFKEGNRLLGWGNNESGQILGETLTRNSPVAFSQTIDWDKIICGNNQSFLLRKNILWGFGSNGSGQLGDSTLYNKTKVTKVYGEQDWKMAVSGDNHTLALKTDNSLWAWGNNDFGQLGNESENDEIIPTQVFGNTKDWAQIFAGHNYSFAIKLDGSLWQWGADFTINETESYPIPVKIGQDNDWKLLACGEKHTLALKNDGSLWAWGRNENYQLGVSSIVYSIEPIRIGFENDWEYIAAGKDYSFAIKKDGSLWAWGNNVSGQLGNGTSIPIQVPTKIANMNHCKKVVCGDGHTIVLKYDGTIWSTGKNDSGQLGMFNNENSFSFDMINHYVQIQNCKDIAAGANHCLAFVEADTEPLDVLQLINPKPNAQVDLGDTGYLTFVWQENEKAVSYDIEIYEENSGIAITFDTDGTYFPNNFGWHPEPYGKTYQWKVKYYTEVDSSDWSETWYFTLDERFIDKVVELKSPENLSVEIPVDYYLQWFELEKPEGYIVQVSINAEFLSDTQTDFTETYLYQLGNKIKLENNTTYYWRVKGVRGTDTTQWCEPWQFTTAEWENPIKAPQLVSPADNALNISISPTLSWEAVSGADSYRVQVAKDDLFTELVFNQSFGTLSTALSDLDYNAKYYWRVNAKIGTDSSNWSVIRQFTTSPLTELATPELTYPVDYSQNISLSPTFNWTSVQGANSYILQVSKENDFLNLVTEQELTNTNYAGATLEFNTNYYWRVQAKAGLVLSDWSEAFTFKTVSNFTLATPDLIAPPYNTIDLQPTVLLRWTAVNGANEYEVMVSKEGNFASTVINEKTNNNSFTAKKLDLLTKYYWKIKALNGEEISDWSDVWSFTTSATLILPTINLKISCDEEYKPGDVQKEIPLAIPIVVESVENYESSMKPDSVIGYFRVRRSMFFPDLNSTLGTVKCEFADSYILNNKITVKKAVENLSPNAIAFHLPGWVLLGDKASSPVILDSVQWIWKNNPDIEFYTNVKNDTIRLKVSNGIEIRTISLKESVSIIRAYPMPLKENSFEIELLNKANTSKNMNIEIYNQAGKLIENLGSKEIKSGKDILRLKFNETYSSGTYILQLSEQGEVINKQIIINK